MTTVEEAKNYFIGRCDEIINLSTRGDVWVFLCGAAMIDYLTQMTTGKKSTGLAYIDFVDKYLSQVNINYKEFQYQDGNMDLPTQMYLILRCGLVHRFSFVPDSDEISNGGRPRSISLAHEESHGNIHFTHYTENGRDTVVFTAEQFSKDIKAVVELIFTNALTDNSLTSNIIKYISNFPPIQSRFN